MRAIERYLVPQVLADLQRKMVFVAGPRQVGKTTLARGLPGGAQGYLNWDVPEDRGEHPPARAAATQTLGLRRDPVQDLGRLEFLMLQLPERVGSPLSINALREDLEVSHKTLSAWLGILERLYAVFRLPPVGAPALRAVKKAQKVYVFDWTLVPDPALRFENLVACHLLKWVHFQQDTQGRDFELRYFRDLEGREVDFVVTERRRPVLMVECKAADAPLDRSLRYLKTRFPDCPAWQLSARGTRDYQTPEGIRVAPGLALLGQLV